MKVMSIVGTRPQFVKLAPISWASRGKFDHVILDSGQHYDFSLSGSFFETLNIPMAQFRLLVDREASHGMQTATMLKEIEKILIEEKPDHVIVYGDTNTTISGALAASKLRIPISHIEAGLRSSDKRQPEEINRVATDHISDLLFAPTQIAMDNLKKEGLGAKSHFTGDVMLDTLNFIQKETHLDETRNEYILATIHRPDNTDNEERLGFIMERLKLSPVPIHLHCHPRLTKMLDRFNIKCHSSNVLLMPPLDYKSMIQKVIGSLGVITDSGGLQKESYFLKRPCMVIKKTTEWVELLASNFSFIDLNLDQVSMKWWNRSNPLASENSDAFGDGNASKRIVELIKASSRET